jgi:hypothetical protein
MPLKNEESQQDCAAGVAYYWQQPVLALLAHLLSFGHGNQLPLCQMYTPYHHAVKSMLLAFIIVNKIESIRS